MIILQNSVVLDNRTTLFVWLGVLIQGYNQLVVIFVYSILALALQFCILMFFLFIIPVQKIFMLAYSKYYLSKNVNINCPSLVII